MKEETNLNEKPIRLLGYCSHHNPIFGDVLLLGIEMEAGVAAAEAKLFILNDLPPLALSCHKKIIEMLNQAKGSQGLWY